MKQLRLVVKNDTKNILDIYTPYIHDTVITFEYDAPSLEAFTKRIESIACDYPYLVCVENDTIIGYAYAHRHMERDAYQWNAELSVYLSPLSFRQGLGKAFYGALIEILRLQNIRNVYGCVTLPNVNSEKLHEYFGFNRVGIYHNAGYKFDQWHDVIWFEKQISEYDFNPLLFASIQTINHNKIDQILEHYTKTINL